MLLSGWPFGAGSWRVRHRGHLGALPHGSRCGEVNRRGDHDGGKILCHGFGQPNGKLVRSCTPHRPCSVAVGNPRNCLIEGTGSFVVWRLLEFDLMRVRESLNVISTWAAECIASVAPSLDTHRIVWVKRSNRSASPSALVSLASVSYAVCTSRLTAQQP